MRVNVDSSVFTDARFKLVARATGLQWHDVIGKCVHIWMSCYDQRKGTLRKVEGDCLVDHEGFSNALCAEGLAIDRGADMEIRGFKQRAGWLKQAEDSGKKGGRKSGESRRKKVEGYPSRKRSEPFNDHEGSANPLTLTHAHALAHALAHAPDHALAPALPLAQENTEIAATSAAASKARKAKPTTPPEPPAEGFTAARDAYVAAFEAKHGERPEFAARQGKALSAMLKAHGPEAVMRKIRLAFGAPPRWPDGPWSLAQIEKHWDLLVAQGAPISAPRDIRYGSAPPSEFVGVAPGEHAL